MLEPREVPSQQSGFTLFELVVVIVILGILTAVAVPRYISLKTEANIAVLEAMGGAILSRANLVYARSLVEGVQADPDTTLDLDGDGVDDVEIAYGYPSASRNNGISNIMDGSFSSDWTWSTTYGDTRFWLTTSKLGGRSGVYVNQTAVRNSGCYILYDPATTTGASPSISYVTTDC